MVLPHIPDLTSHSLNLNTIMHENFALPTVTFLAAQRFAVAGASLASRLAREAGLNVIDDGSCILVLYALEAKPAKSK